MKRFLALLAAAGLTAVACVSAPARRAGVLDGVPPDAWTAAEPLSGEIEPGWWSSFGDPRLDEAVERALADNHDLRAAASRLDQAVAQARIAGANLKPSVGAGANAGRSRTVLPGFPSPTGDVLSFTTSSYGVSLDVSWEADLWGRLRAGARAALADLQAADADLQAARLSLAGQTAKAWFAVAEATEQLRLAEETVASWEESYEQVRTRYERGVRSALDVRLSLTNLEGARAALEARKRALDAATRQLEILLGRYPGRSLAPPDALPDTPAPVPAGLPADLVSRRPDLAAAERRLAAADQRVLEARRSLYPRLTLTGSGGTTTAELSDLLDGDFRVWSLAAGILQPLFQGGRLRAGVDLAEAGTEAAVESFAGAALRAYGEVETALASETYFADYERFLREASDQAEAARKLAEDRYRSGLVPYITVLESQRRASQAESQWLLARRQRLDNRIELFLALGGGFRAPETGPSDAAAVRRVSKAPKENS